MLRRQGERTLPTVASTSSPSLFWLWAVEGVRPDRWDTIGALVALLGAVIIVGGPRG